MKKILSALFATILIALSAPAFAQYDGPAANITLSNPNFIPTNASNLAAGDDDLYTVPANRRGLATAVDLYNNTASTITYHFEVKISGVYYRISADNTVSANSSTTGVTFKYIAEAGESISINTSAVGLNAAVTVLEYDNTSPMFSSKKNSGWVNGDNTIYTVTAGKVGVLLDGGTLVNGTSTNGTLSVCNASGAAVAYRFDVVPSGQTPGTAYTLAHSPTLGNNSCASPMRTASLNAGDFVNVNSNSANANQFSWVTVIEQ